MSIDPKSTYYDAGGIETMKIIEAKISGITDPVEAWYKGNSLKYDCRSPYKGNIAEQIRDVEKILVYNKLLLKRLKERGD
jgi:hypothetical protein